MIDNNTLDLIKEYLNTRERSNMDSELSDILVVRKLLFISILKNLILSKKIFRKNKDIATFLKNNFGISLSDYMIHSRTTICGKIVRIIKEITDEDEINNYLNKLFEILKKINNNDDLEKVDIYSVIERMEL